MEVFGLKSKKVYGLFELKNLTLFMMLIPCFLTQDGLPGFNVTCDSTGLHVKIAFSKPFTGIVYAKGYRFDPLCSVTESSAMKGSIFLPLSACGTYVQETDHPWITNTVVFQHHPLIRTANDFEKSLICSLESSENFWDPQVLLDQIYESHSLSPTEFSSDIKFEPDFFHEETAEILDSARNRLTVFRLVNRTIYNDVVIKSCIAHNEEILNGNSSVRHISNPRGCFSVNSENSSGLAIVKTEGGFIAYVDIKTLEIETSDSVYLTCEVVLCKTKCKCSEIEQGEQATSVISHKLTKRSIGTSSEMLPKQYEARTRFLKSTIKALMDRMVEQRKQNDKKLKIRKRLMRLDDSMLVSGTNDLGSGFAPVKIFSPEPVATDIYNIEPREDYDSDDSDLEDSLHENDENDSDLEDSLHENDENDSDLEDSLHDNDENDDSDLEDSLHNNYDYDSDLDRSHHNQREETTITEFSTADSDIVFVEKYKELEDNDTKTLIDTNFQEKCSKVPTADLVSPLNGVAEDTKTPSTTDISFASADVDAHFGSCVPRLRFVIVTVVMGFFMGCLLLVSCGMALYIRKEKKRNKINDFLLYSISY